MLWVADPLERWWVLKNKDFWPRKKEKNFFKNPLMNCTFKVNFQSQKGTDFFQKKNIFKTAILDLGDHFLVKTFFLDSILELLYFLKLYPIFDELTFLIGIS